MSSTNKTTNYELSQYIGTDKPTYLGDYNADMLKIDTAIKGNADDIDTNTTAINTVTQTANTALTKAEANEQALTTVTQTANSALAKANSNEAKITSLEAEANVVSSETKIGTLNGEDLYRVVITYTQPTAISGTGLQQFDIPTTMLGSSINRIYKVNASYDGDGSGRYNQPLPNISSTGGLIAVNGILFGSTGNVGVRIRAYNFGISANTDFEIEFEYTKN